MTCVPDPPLHQAVADDMSRRALAAHAASPPIRAIRGAVMIAKDEHDEGHPILLSSLPSVEDKTLKADRCAFLARDAERQDAPVNARDYSALSKHLRAAQAK